MPHLRQVTAFFARLLLIYVLLVIPWPRVQAGYTAVFCAGGNVIFRSLIPGGSVRFHPVTEPVDGADTCIHFVNKRTGATPRSVASSRQLGYLPTALLLSLILATPLSWKRQLWTLGWGLVLINLAIACKMLVTALYAFGARASLLKLTPAWAKVLALCNRFVADDMVLIFVVPVLIWILVSFGRTDWMIKPSEQASQAR